MIRTTAVLAIDPLHRLLRSVTVQAKDWPPLATKSPTRGTAVAQQCRSSNPWRQLREATWIATRSESDVTTMNAFSVLSTLDTVRVQLHDHCSRSSSQLRTRIVTKQTV